MRTPGLRERTPCIVIASSELQTVCKRRSKTWTSEHSTRRRLKVLVAMSSHVMPINRALQASRPYLDVHRAQLELE